MKRVHVNLAGIGMLAAASFLIMRSSPRHATPLALRVEISPVPKTSRSSGGEENVRHDSNSRLGNSMVSATAGTILARNRRDSHSTRTALLSEPDGTSAAPLERHSTGFNSLRSEKAARGIHHEGIYHEEPFASVAIGLSNTSDGSPQGNLESNLDSPPVLSPAALIEIDDPAVSLPAAQKRLADIASDFTEILHQSGLDPASIGYRHLWDRERAIADARFRSMYGGQAWMNHHIQSHHAEFRSPTP